MATFQLRALELVQYWSSISWNDPYRFVPVLMVKIHKLQMRDLVEFQPLTHWGWVAHIASVNWAIISSDNVLSPDRRQAIIWTNVGILLIGQSGTNFNEILTEIHTFSFKKMHMKMSGKWGPFCLGLNVLSVTGLWITTFIITIADTVRHWGTRASASTIMMHGQL